MEGQLNILWKKGVPADLYIDIFDIRNHAINVSDAKSVVDGWFVESPDTNKNDERAKRIRLEGDRGFEENKYYEAMELYNLATSFATPGSEEFGLALSRRSVCFLQMNMLENCLTDIKLARQIQREKLAELDAREATCTALMADPNYKSGPYPVWEPKLSFTAHTSFAGVADCLKIQTDNKYGRHVVTTCDLKIGQTILVEPTYAATLPKTYEGRARCWGCFKECMNFIACPNCVGKIYCDENCMEKSFHKLECKRTLCQSVSFELVMRMVFRIIADFPDIDALINVVQLLLNGKKMPKTLTQSQKDFCSIFQLVHHHEKLSADTLTEMRTVTGMLILAASHFPEFKRKYVTLKYQRFFQHLILHLFHVVEHEFELREYSQTINTDPVIDYELRHFATGMYPFACVINHSCAPNICWFNVDGRLICKVISPIEKGQQIFRSYLTAHDAYQQTKKDVKENMEERFHFKCTCWVCTTGWDPKKDDVDLSKDILYQIGVRPSHMSTKELRQLSRSQIQEIEKKAIECLLRYESVHPINDTIIVQNSLQLMWNVLASRY